MGPSSEMIQPRVPPPAGMVTGKYNRYEGISRDASTQLILDRYPHWTPSVGRSTANGMEGVLG